jgi:hypothetical protein
MEKDDFGATLKEILSEKKPHEDYYEVLGCSEFSTPSQIATEYRIKVLECHPVSSIIGNSDYV